MQTSTREEQTKATIEVIKAVAEAIKTLGQVPSGHLYARLMGSLTLDQYQTIIDILEKGRLIKVEHHLITWLG